MLHLPQKSAMTVALGSLVASIGLFSACSDINNSWEVKGGGYIKYSVDGSKSYTIELDDDDVEIPYIRNSHHYLMIHTREEESSRRDIFTIMVNRPVLGDNPIIQDYSKFSAEGSDAGRIYADSSNFHIDQKDDSTWTADLDLYAQDCRQGDCMDDAPRIHITGRFRYWVPADER